MTSSGVLAGMSKRLARKCLVIKGSATHYDLGETAFHAHGMQVECPCPKCSHRATIDLGAEGIYFPQVNDVNTLILECFRCGHEWEERIRLVVKLEAVS